MSYKLSRKNNLEDYYYYKKLADYDGSLYEIYEIEERENCILGFHSRDTGLGNGCYPPSLCPSSVNKTEKRRDANAIV